MTVDLEKDDRIYQSQVRRPCFHCGADCCHVVNGLRQYVCSAACLRYCLAAALERNPLRDWVDFKPEVRVG